MGTYRCICDSGYEVDATGKICSDINECELEQSLCSGGQCRNTPGSFQASKVPRVSNRRHLRLDLAAKLEELAVTNRLNVRAVYLPERDAIQHGEPHVRGYRRVRGTWTGCMLERNMYRYSGILRVRVFTRIYPRPHRPHLHGYE